MSSPSLAATTANPASPLNLNASPSVSRPAAAVLQIQSPPRRRPHPPRRRIQPPPPPAETPDQADAPPPPPRRTSPPSVQLRYIEEVDLLRFFTKEQVGLVLPMFEGASETGKIKKSALKNWVVKAYLDRKSLAHSLNDTKTAVMQLHNLIRVLVIIVIVVITLLLMGIATTKILVVISSQLLVVVFIFGNACKTVFEALIFVFIMHPFDVGDRCVIDGVQMVVEEMNILTTVFLKHDNEKIYYPNSVLSTKPISNFYRSPNMYDTIDFAIDVSTSIESIGALKSRIKGLRAWDEIDINTIINDFASRNVRRNF